MKKILKILYVVVIFLLVITNVSAKELFTADEYLVQDGKYDSIRFACGKSVTNKAEVNGLSFVAGENLTLEGKAPYGFYAGRVLEVSENIENDAFIELWNKYNHFKIICQSFFRDDIWVSC